MIYTLYHIYANNQVSDVVYLRMVLGYLLLFKYAWKFALVLCIIDLLYIWWKSRSTTPSLTENKDQLDFDLVTIGSDHDPDTKDINEIDKSSQI